MTIDEVYRLIQFATNKAQQGYISPQQFNLIINQGSKSFAASLLGITQQYTPGRPVARAELGQNSVVRQRLAPVIYGYILQVDTTGYAPYPLDYIQTDAMWSIYGFQRVRYADQHKFVSIYNSVIDPIRNNPIYVLEDTGFRFFPNDLWNTRLHYVRESPRMEWAYTLDVNSRPVYDPVHSIQPVFDDPAMFEIIGRALGMIGINLQANVIVGYAQELKNSGQ